MEYPRMAQRLKLTLVSPISEAGGGIARCGKFLADALHSQGRLHSLIPLNPLYPDFLYPGEKPTKLTPGMSVQWPVQWGKVVRRLEAEKTDCVILPYWTAWHLPGTFRCTRQSQFRTLGVFHNLIDHDRKFASGVLAKRLVHRFDGIVSHSETVTGAIRRLGYAGPLLTIAEPPPPTPTVTLTSPIPNEVPLLLFSGILRPYKGVEDLVEALSRIQALRWQAILHVAPWRRELAKLKAAIRQRKLESRIRLIPEWLSEESLQGLFSAADLVILPYRTGTGSGVLARSFYHRRPVVVTDVGNLAQLTEQFSAGWVARPSDPESLSFTIQNALSEEALKEKQAELLTKVFPTWDAYAEQVWNFAQTIPAPDRSRSRRLSRLLLHPNVEAKFPCPNPAVMR